MNSTTNDVIIGRAAEKWKNIKIPKKYNTKHTIQISNYGRLRSRLYEETEFKPVPPIYYKKKVLYKLNFPASLNNGQYLILHVEAKKLVAEAFCTGYFEGCYVLHKDYNKLNNYFKNIICLNPAEGRSHAAKSRYRNVAQIPVLPPDPNDQVKKDSSPSRLIEEADYFKLIPKFSKYEINRNGIIRKAVHPHKKKVLKQRKHPDGFYFLELQDNLGKRRTVYTHKAVAWTWNINVDPENKTVVVHKDGNSLNNDADNLEWMTHSEALKYQFSNDQRDNKRSWKTRRRKYGQSGRKSKKQHCDNPS